MCVRVFKLLPNLLVGWDSRGKLYKLTKLSRSENQHGACQKGEDTQRMLRAVI